MTAAPKKKRAPKTYTLTPRELQFVRAYEGSNAKAARAIGMSPRNAEEMMKRPRVAAAIKRKMARAIDVSGEKLGRDLSVTVDHVLKELARLAFFDPRRLFNADGTPKHITDLDDDTAASIAGLDVEKLFEGSGKERERVGDVLKYKIADKGQNLERLGKHLGLFIERYMQLPADFNSRTIEDQEYFCKHGCYPEDDIHGTEPSAATS